MVTRWGKESETALTTRRGFLRLGAGAILGGVALPHPAATAGRPRWVSLYAVHTGEAVSAEYAAGERYHPDALEAISWLLRDHRTDEAYPVDPGVLDVLHGVADLLETRTAFHVVSGYRSRATNEWKRRLGHGVAENSYHLSGRAVDVFLPGRDLARLRRAALSLEAGGVGYYPRSGFVHLDTGPIRRW